MATDQRSTHEASLVLRRERDTALFSQQAAQKRIEMLDTIVLAALYTIRAMDKGMASTAIASMPRHRFSTNSWRTAEMSGSCGNSSGARLMCLG